MKQWALVPILSFITLLPVGLLANSPATPPALCSLLKPSHLGIWLLLQQINTDSSSVPLMGPATPGGAWLQPGRAAAQSGPEFTCQDVSPGLCRPTFLWLGWPPHFLGGSSLSPFQVTLQ